MWLVMDNVLHATGNYAGFNYLTELQVPVGEKPGVVQVASRLKDHSPIWAFPDESRRFFYPSSKIATRRARDLAKKRENKY
jgi:hypothetical protein